MKIDLPIIMMFGASLALAACGCSRKSDAKTQLEKAANALSAAEPAPAAAPQVPSQPTEPVEAATASQPVPAPSASKQMKEALAAYKAGNLEDAVTRLQKLRATPAMTPEQRIALNDAMGAVMTEIYSLAAKGDARAKLAVKQYEEMQTRRQ
jgi:hypothetical protein